MGDTKKRLVIAVTGASCTLLAVDLLRQMRLQTDWETHLICSESAKLTLNIESNCSFEELKAMADFCYDNGRISEKPASGTFQTNGMVVVPCSMKTLAGICSGYSDNLILRAADVTLKERRPLVLVPRETPLSQIHLRNLYELSKIGAILMPPMMTFYQRPEKATDMVRHITGKIMNVFGLEAEFFCRWGEEKDAVDIG